MRRIAIAAVLAALALAGCASRPGPAAVRIPGSPPPGGMAEVHDPGHVTGTITGPCHARDGGLLPDPQCTPGAVDPAVTRDNLSTTICVPWHDRHGKIHYRLSAAWSAGRPASRETSEFKYLIAYPAYGLPADAVSKLDHLVPRETGGSNDARNLWPETSPGDHRKDTAENVLHFAVCSGKVTLVYAQAAIAHNWITAEKDLGLTPDIIKTGESRWP